MKISKKIIIEKLTGNLHSQQSARRIMWHLKFKEEVNSLISLVGYTETVDWWSMGVILYEMLVGYPPFASEEPRETWHKIQNWRKYLVIPKDADVSPQAADLIRKLIADPKDRLGANGVQEIKAHPFFSGINWSKLRYYCINFKRS